MKKQYIKPGIVIEDFSIAQNIATNCGYGGGSNYTHSDPYHCAWDVDGLFIFTETVSSCLKNDVDPDAEFAGYCYNNPTQNLSMFGSY